MAEESERWWVRPRIWVHHSSSTDICTGWTFIAGRLFGNSWVILSASLPCSSGSLELFSISKATSLMKRTLRSLTYSAPFAAPRGWGFCIMNRMVDPKTLEWKRNGSCSWRWLGL
jgi:hypothetical protein